MLLVDDHFGGGFADRQAPTEAVRLDVVVDQYCRAVLVAVQAVDGQGEDVFRASPCVDADLRRDPHLDRFEGVEVSAEEGQDLRGNVAAGFAAFGVGGELRTVDGEVTSQAPCCLAGPGQAEGADGGQELAYVPEDAIAAESPDLPGPR